MPHIAVLLYTMLCCYIAAFFGIQAQAWLEQGAGLHPFLAIPAACFFGTLPFFTNGLIREFFEGFLDDEDEYFERYR